MAACLFKCVIYPVFQFRSEDSITRTPESYDYHFSLLDGPLYKENSITYVIKFGSPLNELNNFHVVDQLPQDIMHVLLEGAIPYELELLPLLSLDICQLLFLIIIKCSPVVILELILHQRCITWYTLLSRY